MPFDLAILAGSFVAAAGAAAGAANATQAARQADDALLAAAATRDAGRLDALLDPDFTWTDADGRTLARAEVLAGYPRPAEQAGAELAARCYGDVAVVTSKRDAHYAMRIFVRRGGSWRALVYHEVKHVPGGAAAHASPNDVDTGNPCRFIPYEPASAAQRALIESWQKLERAVVAGDGEEWARYVADEFIVVGNQRIQTKAERRAAVGKGGAAPPPLLSARMHEYGDAVVMTSLHQPYGRKPTRVSRVFVKGETEWLMAISYQTTIQAPAAPGR